MKQFEVFHFSFFLFFCSFIHLFCMPLISPCGLGLHTFYTLHLVRFRSFFLHTKLHTFTHFLHTALPRFQLINHQLNFSWIRAELELDDAVLSEI